MQKYNKTQMAEIKKWYDNYSADCRAALRLTVARVTNIEEAFRASGERNPIDSIHHRIKSFNSVINKCHIRGYDVSIDSISRNVKDVAGIRVVTPFIDDIYRVNEMVKATPGIILAEEKDYVKNPKPNGYSSLHLNVQIEIYSPLANKSKLVPLEIQIRDKAMEMWAAIEHIISYKKSSTPTAEKMFKEMADNLRLFDKKALELRDYNIKSEAKNSKNPPV